MRKAILNTVFTRTALVKAVPWFHMFLVAGGWVVFSVLVSELAGYLLHRLLHSGKIRWLSRSHMEHHLQHYGPRQPMRPSTQYIDSTTGRWAIGNVGLEWIVPSGILMGAFLAAFALLRVPWAYRTMFIGITLGWTSFLFSYLHDRMHLRGFWMERNRLLKSWFVAARRLHDIHHLSLNDRGRMDRNFGIGFFLFDRVFGTLRTRLQAINYRGLEAARQRYECGNGAGDSNGNNSPTHGNQESHQRWSARLEEPSIGR